MNNGDALKALQEYYDVTNPTPDDEFKFTEALGYLIEETKNPKYMTELGWYYCSKKRFDLEIKYLEMAAEYGYLSVEAFWGHIEVMGRIIRFLYELQSFDTEEADFYDLFYLTEKPGKYSIKRNGKKIGIEIIDEDGEKAIGYNGKWYRSFEDLCQRAELGSDMLTTIYDEFYDVEVAG